MRKATILIPVLAVVLFGLLSSIFIVDEREKALVLQFGQIRAVKEDPGLAFKIPLIQEVVRYQGARHLQYLVKVKQDKSAERAKDNAFSQLANAKTELG